MRRGRKLKTTLTLSCVVAPLLAAQPASSKEPKRPHILGIHSVAISSSNLTASSDFYLEATAPEGRAVLEQHDVCVWCEKTPLEGASPLFALPSGQAIVLASNPTNSTNLLRSITYVVDDERELKKYLKARGVKFTEQVGPFREPNHTLSVLDPEGHRLHFVRSRVPAQSGLRIIHAGFIVRDRAAMEHFYKDILGFRPYWHGGMTDDQTDWVSLQVPDGTDWVEFMVNVPENADRRLRGIVNHISLGVPDIQAAREQLVKNGLHLTEEPKLGRDGKWQLNLYDPDQTRIEFMECTPKEKPCCSEFTGPHPKP
jgi:catechol 2,3-dioxygenase-like lactoylglutathione lyase family enzyme